MAWRSGHLTRFLPVLRNAIFRSFATEPGHGMPLTLACPAAVFYHNKPVRQIDVPSLSGSFGILPHHVPVLALLKPGVVTVFEEDGTSKKFFVSSGTFTVNDDSSVQVLAEEACKIEDLSAQACKEGLAIAHRELAAAADDVAKAESQIKVEVHEALVKAVEQGI